MVGIVQIMDHHSLAHALLDIVVTAAKSKVSVIFKNVLSCKIHAKFDGILFPFPFLSLESILWSCVLFHHYNSAS
jgi:hypothetical protein